MFKTKVIAYLEYYGLNDKLYILQNYDEHREITGSIPYSFQSLPSQPYINMNIFVIAAKSISICCFLQYGSLNC